MPSLTTRQPFVAVWFPGRLWGASAGSLARLLQFRTGVMLRRLLPRGVYAPGGAGGAEAPAGGYLSPGKRVAAKASHGEGAPGEPPGRRAPAQE